MADRLHVIMPCSRPANIPVIAGHFLIAMEPHNFELRWHICVQGPEPDPKGFNKINECISEISAHVHHSDWVWTPSDDSLPQPSLFRKLEWAIRQHPSAGCIVFSEERGNGDPNCPWTGEPWPKDSDRILHALPENMVPCRVDGTQAFFQRTFLGEHRFEDHPEGDGRLIQKLFQQAPGKFVFVDEPLVKFNSMQW